MLILRTSLDVYLQQFYGACIPLGCKLERFVAHLLGNSSDTLGVSSVCWRGLSHYDCPITPLDRTTVTVQCPTAWRRHSPR